MKSTATEYVEDALHKYVQAGWEITSDGPSGVQLVSPKKMMGLDKCCLVAGILTVWVYGFGLILIGIALIDYAVLTKRESKLLVRRPPPLISVPVVKYFLKMPEGITGPHTIKDIEGYLNRGLISSEHYVQKEGVKEWRKCSEVFELESA